MKMKHKYPRTLHLPWSPGVSSDDKVHKDISVFEGQRVYVAKDQAGNLADKWFNDNNISDLTWKCKAWNSVLNCTTSVTAEKIKSQLSEIYSIPPEGIELRYSRKAGCACGCSPGYVGLILNSTKMSDGTIAVAGKDIWGEDIQCSEEELKILTDELEKASLVLKKEISKKVW